MNMFRKIFALILALVLILPLALDAKAADTTTDDLIRQMLGYYLYYRGEAQTDFDLLLEEMEKLPDKQRTVLKMRAMDGLEYDDISKRTGLSKVHVRVLVTMARKTLKSKIRL